MSNFEQINLSPVNTASVVLSPRRSFVQKTITVPYDVVTCPSVLLAAGNILYTYHSDRFGFYLSVAQTSATALCAAYQSISGSPKELPAYAVGAFNLVTSISYLYQINGSELVAFGKAAWGNLASGLAFAGWFAANTLRGLHEDGYIKSKALIADPMLYYGFSDMSAVKGDLGSILATTIGLCKIGQSPETEPISKNIWQKVNRGTTTARMFGVSYFIDSAVKLVTTDPYVAAGEVLWGIFYMQIDKRNIQLLSRIKDSLRLKYGKHPAP